MRQDIIGASRVDAVSPLCRRAAARPAAGDAALRIPRGRGEAPSPPHPHEADQVPLAGPVQPSGDPIG
jgi:hypothetical protein